MKKRYSVLGYLGLFIFVTTLSCDSEDEVVWECTVAPGTSPKFTQIIGCETDFTALASEPLDASIPGAMSVKTVIDRLDGDALYFQNSMDYEIHWNFARENLSGNGKPIVPEIDEFNRTEYYSEDRRFMLGAITYYEGPQAWVYEIAPYDTSSPDMIESAYHTIADSTFFGKELYFHPTSQLIAEKASQLSNSVKVISTDELYSDIDFQPLNLGRSCGNLTFMTAEALETEYVGFRDIVVLDNVPNDISVVQGIITEEFQTPLSHVNVLSQNRGTPNMGLRGAYTDEQLRALEGKSVCLEVGAFEYSIKEVTSEEANSWWESNKPAGIQIPDLDLDVTDLRNIEEVLDPALELGEALSKAIPAFGGKASHFGGLAKIGPKVPTPKAFAVPVYYYWQFMEDNGFNAQLAAMREDDAFKNDANVRDAQLAQLREDMKVAPVDEGFQTMLLDKLAAEYPGIRMRFRSSTNCEDLGGFTGAGLYTSQSGDPNDESFPVFDAVRAVWASVWNFRAYEERTYRSISHEKVGMALLVHNSFVDEEANGVALTSNPFDTSGLVPGFYINVQVGEASVVQPNPGVTTDQFVYQFSMPNQPILSIAHSNLIPDGQTVITKRQAYDLGVALDAIHKYFSPVYGQELGKWYAMDVEFKFDDINSPGQSTLFVKQARPHFGWGHAEQ